MVRPKAAAMICGRSERKVESGDQSDKYRNKYLDKVKKNRRDCGESCRMSADDK